MSARSLASLAVSEREKRDGRGFGSRQVRPDAVGVRSGRIAPQLPNGGVGFEPTVPQTGGNGSRDCAERAAMPQQLESPSRGSTYAEGASFEELHSRAMAGELAPDTPPIPLPQAGS